MMQKRKCLCIILSLLLIATLAACAKKSESPTYTEPAQTEQKQDIPNELEVGGAQAQTNRKIIMNASAVIKVISIVDSIRETELLTLQAGGYVKESFVNQNNGRVTLMIPAGDLDSFLLGLESMGKVITKTKSSEDVTDVYFDTEVRIRNLEAEIVTMRALLQRDGWKVTEILEIEREIRRLTDELELLKGKLSNMDRRVQFSQLDIDFIIEKTNLIAGDSENFAYKIKSAFKNGIDTLINIVEASLSVIVFVLPLLPIAIFIYIIWRFIINPLINNRVKK